MQITVYCHEGRFIVRIARCSKGYLFKRYPRKATSVAAVVVGVLVGLMKEFRGGDKMILKKQRK